MAEIDNKTGAPHFWFEQTGPEGERLDVLVVRATFDFAINGELMTLASSQQPISFGDSFSGPVGTDPMRAVIKEDGDLLPYKPGTDILITGNAHAPGGKAQPTWLASISVGPVTKTLRLHGPRQFCKGFFGWRLGDSAPVARVRLDYRLAYGGCIDIPAEAAADGSTDFFSFSGNPAGCGWLPKKGAYKHLPKLARKHLQKWVNAQAVLQAPQFEAATAPIRSPYQDITPQGFSAIARWWQPRLAYQGSCDEQWRASRYPLLPKNFSSRYFQSAPADLVCTPHLSGDELVAFVGLLSEKHAMRLPGWRLLAVVSRASGESTVSYPILDTVRLDLDSRQVSLVWRANFDCEDPVVQIALAATTVVIESDNSSTEMAPVAEVDR